jgi:hypothetical protein
MTRVAEARPPRGVAASAAGTSTSLPVASDLPSSATALAAGRSSSGLTKLIVNKKTGSF